MEMRDTMDAMGLRSTDVPSGSPSESDSIEQRKCEHEDE